MYDDYHNYYDFSVFLGNGVVADNANDKGAALCCREKSSQALTCIKLQTSGPLFSASYFLYVYEVKCHHIKREEN